MDNSGLGVAVREYRFPVVFQDTSQKLVEYGIIPYRRQFRDYYGKRNALEKPSQARPFPAPRPAGHRAFSAWEKNPNCSFIPGLIWS
jgi:hypothetical protein